MDEDRPVRVEPDLTERTPKGLQENCSPTNLQPKEFLVSQSSVLDTDVAVRTYRRVQEEIFRVVSYARLVNLNILRNNRRQKMHLVVD